MKIHSICRVCKEPLKLEEMHRGTCEDCEKEITLYIIKQLDRKVRVG